MKYPQPGMKPQMLDMIEALRNTPMTRLEIHRFYGIHESVASRRIQRLKKRGLIRIVAWQRTEGSTAPVYGPADGKPDAPKPPRMSHNERQRKYRERHQVRISVRRYGERSTLTGIWAGLGAK